MGDLFNFWFWLALLIAIVVLLVIVDQVEESNAYRERRRAASAREAERVLQEMDASSHRDAALQSIAEWKRSQ